MMGKEFNSEENVLQCVFIRSDGKSLLNMSTKKGDQDPFLSCVLNEDQARCLRDYIDEILEEQ